MNELNFLRIRIFNLRIWPLVTPHLTISWPLRENILYRLFNLGTPVIKMKELDTVNFSFYHKKCSFVCMPMFVFLCISFHRCIIWPRRGRSAHWGCVRGPPGGSERHADPQRAAVHVFRRPDRQSLRLGGECRLRTSTAGFFIFLWIEQPNKPFFSFFLLQTHKCVGVFEGHSSKVSCLLISAAPCLHHRLYSGSSDQTIRCYSLKVKTRFLLLSFIHVCFHCLGWFALFYSPQIAPKYK